MKAVMVAKHNRREIGESHPSSYSTINMVANYYKPGPATRSDVRARIANPSSRGDGDHGSWHVADNHVDGSPEVTADNWLGVAWQFLHKAGGAMGGDAHSSAIPAGCVSGCP